MTTSLSHHRPQRRQLRNRLNIRLRRLSTAFFKCGNRVADDQRLGGSHTACQAFGDRAISNLLTPRVLKKALDNGLWRCRRCSVALITIHMDSRRRSSDHRYNFLCMISVKRW